MSKNHVPKSIQTVGEAIYWLRGRQRITLRALASHIGVSPAFLSDVEHNRRSPANHIDKIAEFLNCHPDDLSSRDGHVSREMSAFLKKNPWLVHELRKMMMQKRWRA